MPEESNIEIKDVSSLGQYILNNKLITIIGEFHDSKHNCLGNTISIPEYCLYLASETPRITFYLEVNKGIDIERVLNGCIREVAEALEDAGLGDRIVKYDVRKDFIGLDAQQDLYSGDEELNRVCLGNLACFKRKYIDPFFRTKTRKINGQEVNIYELDHPGLYVKGGKDYLENTFYPSMVSEFTELSRGLESGNFKIRREDLILRLRKLWKNVVDYFLLEEILRKDNPADSIVVICGEFHAVTINKVLDKLGKKVFYQENTKENQCARVRGVK